jgi:hypothetical protein
VAVAMDDGCRVLGQALVPRVPHFDNSPSFTLPTPCQRPHTGAPEPHWSEITQGHGKSPQGSHTTGPLGQMCLS